MLLSIGVDISVNVRGKAMTPYYDAIVIGAGQAGPSLADEAVHALLDIMYAQQPYTVVARAVHIHPTVSELIPTVLQSLRPLE